MAPGYRHEFSGKPGHDNRSQDAGASVYEQGNVREGELQQLSEGRIIASCMPYGATPVGLQANRLPTR